MFVERCVAAYVVDSVWPVALKPKMRTSVMSPPADRIAFNQPTLQGRELQYIEDSVAGGHTSASGPYSRRAADILREATSAEDVLLTTSCTAALEMTGLLLGLRPGDTVIVPSYTFVTTALAYARGGAKLLFCDIEPDTLGLDSAHLETLIDDSVRAVVTVHYAGVGSDLSGIKRVLERHPHVNLVEDNAHGLFGSYQERPLGSFGRFSTLSFHETKNFVCGEGGALLLNDAADVDRAHVLYDKGTNRRAFLLGEVDKYSWQDMGSSFGLSDTLAAYLYGQLEQRDTILAKRRAVFERYVGALAPHAESHGFQLPTVPRDREQAYHMFYLLLPDKARRDATLAHLAEQGVHATFHYVPLHSSPGAQPHLAHRTDCPVTDDISGRLLRLPFHNEMSWPDIERVVESFLEAQAVLTWP